MEIEELEIKVSAETDDLDEKLKSISSKFGSLQKSINAANFNKITDAVKPLKDVSDKVSELTSKYANLGKNWKFDGNLSESESMLKSLQRQLEDAKVAKEKLEMSGKTDTSTFENQIAKIQLLQNKIETVSSKIRELQDISSGFSNLQINLLPHDDQTESIDSYSDSLQRFKDLFESTGQVSAGFTEVFDDLRSKFPQNKELIEQYQQLLDDFNLFQANVDSTKSIDLKSQLFQDKISDKIKEFESVIAGTDNLQINLLSQGTNTESIESYIEDLQRFRDLFDMSGQVSSGFTKVFDDLKAKFPENQELIAQYQQLFDEFKLSQENLNTPQSIDLTSRFEYLHSMSTKLKETMHDLFPLTPTELFSESVSRVKDKLAALKDGISNILGSFKNLASKGVNAFKKIGSAINKNHSLSTKLGKSLTRVGNIIRLIVIRSAIRQMFSGVREGFENLFQYSQKAAQSFALLHNSTKQLGNSVAAMVAPLLNAFAPALDYIIQLVIKATNAINQLLSALTGNGTWIRAQKLTDSYGKSVGGVTKQLSKLDELNNLSSGSGGGGTNPKDMFETLEVPEKFKNLADWLKKMWKKGDFTELGKAIGDKLKAALDNIDWNRIQASAKKVAHSLATFINGFIEVEDLGTSIGKTLAQGVNTAFYTLQEFVRTLHWDSLGKFIADSINGFFDTVDWSAIGSTISDTIKGLLDATIALIENMDFKKAFSPIGDMVKSFDWGGVTADVSRALGDLFGTVTSQLTNFMLNIGTSIHDYFSSFIEKAREDGRNVAQGVLDGIIEKFKSIGAWIKANIFDPFINGFKACFKINSPSLVMFDMGIFVIEGLKEGISSIIDQVIQPFEKMRDTIKSVLDTVKSNIKNSLGEMLTNISDWVGKVTGLTDKLKEKFESISGSISGGAAAIGGIVSNMPNSQGRMIPAYATGGFPEDGLFYANHNELIGSFNGHTAVANNQMIVDGIKQAVSDAVVPYLNTLVMDTGRIVESNAQIASKDIEVSSSGIFKTVRNEAKSFSRMTGQHNAFTF